MDTEEIATEIVRIRQRLAQLEGHDDAATDDEHTRLHDRLRHLQDVMSGHVGDRKQDSPAQPDSVRYVPPA